PRTTARARNTNTSVSDHQRPTSPTSRRQQAASTLGQNRLAPERRMASRPVRHRVDRFFTPAERTHTTEVHRDIEEPDDLLDSQEAAPVQFWEEKQRELVTSVVDYNLSTLSDLIQAKTIDLQPKYQRRFRWDESRQSKLIESFLMNVP